MQRRAVLLGSGAFLAGAAALRTNADPVVSGAYDVTLGIEAAKEPDEFLCRIVLRTAELGRLHENSGSFKRGTPMTIRIGEGRPDGSAVDLTVNVSVDPSGGAQLVATITDRGRIVSVQRTTIALPRV